MAEITHLYVYESGVGFHAPSLAVRVEPTATVPLIVGVAVVVKVPAATAIVAADNLGVSAFPVFDHVTVSFRYFAKSAAVKT